MPEFEAGIEGGRYDPWLHLVTGCTARYPAPSDDNGQREKPVIYFNHGSKPLILNMVNWDMIETAYGPDSDAWIGKPIELYVDPNVMYGARRVGGIRIRIPSSPILSLEQVLKAIADAGITREELRGEIEKHGHKG